MNASNTPLTKSTSSENSFNTVLLNVIGVSSSSLTSSHPTNIFDNAENSSSFSFTKEFDSNQSNEDLIYINYSRNNVYISRSCGYKMEYEIDNIIVENDNLNWIEDSIIEKQTINNEISHHVKIYH